MAKLWSKCIKKTYAGPSGFAVDRGEVTGFTYVADVIVP